ncbi:cellulose biosynthesis regulator diguanylate cyclase DgcQ [Enterobacter sp. CC120223-11]|uniref:cellulose biosynthesis regulator diguanylate cyclase DgcQ n=1 Tax=Enterobacter sp. CC120223-11 TaxID=1378073 RepID=UPI000BD9F4EA|nr:cellulose biosynthesis regulator diguanylate cyclase DgcQ [Enterobacter sp. CC120223-11]SNY79543.1 diguanylate cyclase (GGDEF) domain-containing protein [Enterobacter sp. CC120223-11]
MPHVTKVDNPRWLKSLSRHANPGRVVNYCFFIVFFFSTILTWREVVVLEEAYISSQRNTLENVAHEFNNQLQVSIDRLTFYRNGMQAALEQPLAFEVLRQAGEEFERKRTQHQWSILLDNQRTLPVHGVSDAFVDETTILSRENALLGNELTATLEVGYLLRLSTTIKRAPQQMMYVSRGGFFISSRPVSGNNDLVERYYALVTSPWFADQSQRNNPGRGVRWLSWMLDTPDGPVRRIAVSLPVDYQHYWFGVLTIEFSLTQMKSMLATAAQGEEEGEYRLYDRQMNLLASSLPEGSKSDLMSETEKAQLAQAFEHDNRGGLRFTTNYVNWERIRNFDGVLVRIHHLDEGVRGDFGTISVVLSLVWALFTAMLILSWVVIRRMVRNMSTLQSSLQWQAWHDGLTRLYNRSTLFDLAGKAAKRSEAKGEPLSVVQLDLDYFKSINDRFGHQAGDRVLSHVASMISSQIREDDLAGRVGGEEFCLVLPGASKEEACAMAERVRARINNREILIGKGTTLRISASLGVSSSDEKGLFDIEHLQSVADGRLYLAKQNGRNQVCCQDEDSQ